MPILFDGIDDKVDVGTASTFKYLHGAEDTANFKVTLSVWIKTTDATPGGNLTILATNAFVSTTVGFGLIIQNRGAGKSLRCLMQRGVSGQPTYDDDDTTIQLTQDTNWHHVVFTYNQTPGSGNANFYEDGSSIGSGDKSGNTPSTADALAALDIGQATTASSFFDGQISELALWDVELTATEILQLNDAKLRGMPLQNQPSGLRAYWPIDDGPDGTSADGDTVKDLSSADNNGTGNHGGGAAGLTWKAEEVLSYPSGIIVPGVAVGVAATQQDSLSKLRIRLAAITKNALSIIRIRLLAVTQNSLSVLRVRLVGITKNSLSIARIRLLGVTQTALSIVRIGLPAQTVTALSILRIRVLGVTATALSKVAIAMTAARTALSIMRIRKTGVTAAALSILNIATLAGGFMKMNKSSPDKMVSTSPGKMKKESR